MPLVNLDRVPFETIRKYVIKLRCNLELGIIVGFELLKLEIRQIAITYI